MTDPRKRRAVPAAPEANTPVAVEVVADNNVIPAPEAVVVAAPEVVVVDAPVAVVTPAVVNTPEAVNTPVSTAPTTVANPSVANRLWSSLRDRSYSAGSSIVSSANVARNRVVNSSRLERTAVANTALTLGIMAADLYRNPGSSISVLAAATGLTAAAITAVEGAGYGAFRVGSSIVNAIRGKKRKAQDMQVPVAPQVQETTPVASTTIDALAAAAVTPVPMEATIDALAATAVAPVLMEVTVDALAAAAVQDNAAPVLIARPMVMTSAPTPNAIAAPTAALESSSLRHSEPKKGQKRDKGDESVEAPASTENDKKAKLRSFK